MTRDELIAELAHRINSPLAAVRNAIYLAGCHSSDAVLHHYLELADQEISAIASVLHEFRVLTESEHERHAVLVCEETPGRKPTKKAAA